MDLKLKGKTAIITASGKGIGKTTAHVFAREGANVLINDLDPESADSAVEEIRKHGVESYAIYGDVSEEEPVKKMVDFTIEKFGRIDILVNNVGTGVMSPIWEMETADWDRVLAVSLKSHFLASKYVLRHMIEQRYGKIVNISSCERIYSTPNLPISSYTAAKAGVSGLTREMAQEAAPFGINVNCVAPGNTAVERIKEGGGATGSTDSEKLDWDEIGRKFLPKVLFKRWGEPVEIANAVVFLCSDAASFITGVTLDVNGGIVMV